MKEVYESLRKVHTDLPPYEVINDEFEISSIEKPEFLLRKIVRQVLSHVEDLQTRMHASLDPEPGSLFEMYETGYITEVDREILYSLYKQAACYVRMLHVAELSHDNKIQAETIGHICSQLPAVRQQLLPLLKKLAECWTKKQQVRKSGPSYLQ
jgi:hypothetical protein